MARLENKQGRYLELEPVAYQFATGANEYDLNWLQIRIAVDNGEYQWTANDPALLNWELIDLIKWLRRLVARNETSQQLWQATEPCLQLEGSFDSHSVRLSVSLGYEFLPPVLWQQKRYAQRVIIDFESDDSQIAGFAAALAAEVQSFPVRKP